MSGTKIALRTEEEQQASVREREERERAELEKEIDFVSITDVQPQKSPAENAEITEPDTVPLDTDTAADGGQDVAESSSGAKAPNPPKPTAAPSVGYPHGIRPQPYRAYLLWHEENLDLETICGRLRTVENPLAKSTVMCVSTSRSLLFDRS